MKFLKNWFRRLRKGDPQVFISLLLIWREHKGKFQGRHTFLQALEALTDVIVEVNKTRGLTPSSKSLIRTVAQDECAVTICSHALEAKGAFSPDPKSIETDEDIVTMALSDPEVRREVSRLRKVARKDIIDA